MSVQSGRARIQLVLKDIDRAWDQIRHEWNDPAAMAIERGYVEPLHAQVKAALNAMDKMGQVLQSIRHECGDSSRP